MAALLSWVTLALLSYLLLFQLALAAGAPLGRAAWGGAHRVLPAGLRRGSLVSALVVGLGLLLVAEHAGHLTLLGQPARVSAGLFVLALLFGLSTVANLLSSSPWERLQGVPVALLLSLGCAYLALID